MEGPSPRAPEAAKGGAGGCNDEDGGEETYDGKRKVVLFFVINTPVLTEIYVHTAASR